jgi:hypothetical protein
MPTQRLHGLQNAKADVAQ